MCVSSHRWNQFEAEFGQDNSRKLYIEVFTKNDIELFVRETLERDPGYQGMMEDEGNPIDLLQEIVNASQGVFLWVFLVVRSLLSGITEGDQLVHVLKKPNSLPKDVEEYFKHVLENDIDLKVTRSTFLTCFS
ncbi:hypothetical protein BGZ60DRAFT_566538 [Tricladium varicosporioides]|nr:hypothetical protein BGZ60DRAFT_566538 [Hymenoscyphus varicosporioides]